jgi:hypothetical protein
VELAIDLAAGKFRVEWVNVLTGAVERREQIDHAGGPTRLKSPRFQEDIALRLLRE